jgi:transglutaminase-like putative cysteine protease
MVRIDDAVQARPATAPTTPGDGSGSPRRPGPRRGASVVRWPLSLSLLVLLMAGCSAMGAILSGSAWWLALGVVAAIVFAAAAGFRRAGVAAPMIPVLSSVALVVVLTLFFGGGTGVLWLVPTGETLDRFTDLVLAGVRSIQTQDTPAEVVDGILFLLAVGVGLLAIFMDTVAIGLRVPALAGVPALVPLLAPGFVDEAGADASALVATALAYLLLLRVEMHLRGLAVDSQGGAPGLGATGSSGATRGAIAIAAIGVVGALVVSVAVPVRDAGAFGTRPNSALFGSGVSPMIDLGEDLRRPKAGPALHYRTTATEQPYLALLTLDDIKGTSWLPRSVEPDPDKKVVEIEEPPGLSDQVARTTATTVIGIDGVRTDLLPVPVPATSVVGLAGKWSWNNNTRAITSRDATTIGQRYTVTSLQIEPTREQLRQSGGRYPVSIEPSLLLPNNTPAIINEAATAVTQDTESNYDAAVALQDYLRGSDFRYDTEAPVEEGYDGGGAEVIGTFLEVKRGYCVHFASAMALMARSVGIPSRVALGYLPGTRTSTVIGGLNRYDVTSDDLHAWPELYFLGVGWVPFEPTPGRGSVPDYARQESAATPGVPTGAAAPETAPRTNENPNLNGERPDAVGAGEDNLPETLWRIAVVALLVFLLLLVPGILRRQLRRRRRRQVAAGRAGAPVAWQELCDTAMDYGAVLSDTQTVRELAAEIRSRPGLGDTPDAQAALQRLLVQTEHAHYSRTPAESAAGQGKRGAGLLDDLDVVLAALKNGASLAARARAVVLPASLSTAVLRRMGLGQPAPPGAEAPLNQRSSPGA